MGYEKVLKKREDKKTEKYSHAQIKMEKESCHAKE
jgi:hypothetical protein